MCWTSRWCPASSCRKSLTCTADTRWVRTNRLASQGVFGLATAQGHKPIHSLGMSATTQHDQCFWVCGVCWLFQVASCDSPNEPSMCVRTNTTSCVSIRPRTFGSILPRCAINNTAGPLMGPASGVRGGAGVAAWG
jgi:hypothetical protein